VQALCREIGRIPCGGAEIRCAPSSPDRADATRARARARRLVAEAELHLIRARAGARANSKHFGSERVALLACALQSHTRMLIKALSISLFAAGAGLALSKVAAVLRGRRGAVPTPVTLNAVGDVSAQRVRTPSENLGAAAGVLPVSSLARPSVLPVAFWDAASDRLDEEEPPAPTPPMRGYHPDSYDSIDPEDLTLEWLTRATDAPAPNSGNVDDLAEVDVGSSSMMSEASHNAARSAETLEADTQRLPWTAPESRPDAPESSKAG
jgi:hypothetical protein